jgi:uncharacterized protein (TIGR02996 family)
MTERDESFLQAICATPEDDLPRLVFADFLEDRGDPASYARAEFIRLQCERARLPDDDSREAALAARETELHRHFRRAWNGPLHRRLQAGPLRGEVRSRGLLRAWNYRRGFVAEVTAHATAVVRYPDELLRLGPLEHLRVRRARPALATIITGPVLQQVKELDLAGNELSDGDIAHLLHPALARLRFLDLRRNLFGQAVLAQLDRAVRDGQLPRLTLLVSSPGGGTWSGGIRLPTVPPPMAPGVSALARWLRRFWPGGG